MLSRLLLVHSQNLTGYRFGVSSESGAAQVFRLPRSAYLLLLFLFFGALPVAFTAQNFSFDGQGSAQGAPGVFGWQTTILLIPLLAAVFIARTATFVDADGIRVRALFGSQLLTWSVSDGAVRMPCVHVRDLAAVSRASAGRLPEIAEPRPKFAPQRRRRRAG